MMFQVEFVKDGTRFATPVISEASKNLFIKGLGAKGISYFVIEREDKKWQCAKVVFDIQLVDAAKKAIKENKDMDGIYTFGDKDRVAKEDTLVKVECVDGRLKNAYVVGIWLATAQEIYDFKARIGYKRLGLVKSKV